MFRWHFAFIVGLTAISVPVTANQSVIIVDASATPGGNGSARFPLVNDCEFAIRLAKSRNAPDLSIRHARCEYGGNAERR
jgi:hypothetical protein